MFMKRNFLALSIVVCLAFGITGCDDSVDQSQADATVKSEVTTAVNADQVQLKKFLTDMQKIDPSIVDMYYGYDNHGNKVLHIIRKNNLDQPASSSSSVFLASASSVANPFQSKVGSVTGSWDDSVPAPVAPTVLTDTSVPVPSALLGNGNLNANNTGTAVPSVMVPGTSYSDYSWNLDHGLMAILLYKAFMGGGFSAMTHSYVPSTQMNNLSQDDLRKRKNNNAYAYNSFLTSYYRTSYNAGRSGSSYFSSSGSSDESVSSGSRSSGVFSSGSSARAGGYSAGS
jgi:hypothetical protein